jgi:hypothetical protein
MNVRVLAMSADLIHTLELAGGCIAFGLLVIRFSRRRKISFRYTTGWLLICALGVFASLLLPMMTPLATWLQLSPIALLIVITAVGVALLFLQLTVSISGNQRRVDSLTQETALLREKLERRQVNKTK